MNKTMMFTGLHWLWLSLVVLVLDLGSKQWVIAHFWLGKSVQIIPFINFTYAHNPGTVFGFLADRGEWQRWVFSTITVIIAVLLLVMMYRSDKQSRSSSAAYAMIIGGALGNLFDRMTHGVVIDFIDLYIGDWHWPTFNVADIGICIGAVMIVLDGFCHPTDKTARQKK